MKIIFSVYLEDPATEVNQLRFSDVIETNWDIPQIDKHLQLYDRFRSLLEVGTNIAFWDIFCFGDFTQDIINKIKIIPTAKIFRNVTKEPHLLRIETFDPGDADVATYPATDDYYFYKISRYECGATGYDAIIAYIKEDPVLAGLISCLVFEFFKAICKKIFYGLFGKRKIFKTSRKKQTIYFSSRKFYQNFEQMTRIGCLECQIVGLEKLKNGLYKVSVRTANEAYEATSKYNGKILDLSQTRTNIDRDFQVEQG